MFRFLVLLNCFRCLVWGRDLVSFLIFFNHVDNQLSESHLLKKPLLPLWICGTSLSLVSPQTWRVSPFHSAGCFSSPSISTTCSSLLYCYSLHLLLPAHLAFQEPRLLLTFHASILILGLACKLPQNKQVSWGFCEPRSLQNCPWAWEVPCACYFPRVSREVLPVTCQIVPRYFIVCACCK